MAAESIDARTAAEMMKAGDAIIDVRTPAEYRSGHIRGAINIPIDTLPGAVLPDGAIITTCAMGGRAGRAAQMLDTMGREAFSIRGGTRVWEQAGLPVVGGAEPGPALK